MKLIKKSRFEFDHSNDYIELILRELSDKHIFEDEIIFDFYYSRNDKKCRLTSVKDISIIQNELNERLEQYNESTENSYSIDESILSRLGNMNEVIELVQECQNYLDEMKKGRENLDAPLVLTKMAEYKIRMQVILEYVTNIRTSQDYALKILMDHILKQESDS